MNILDKKSYKKPFSNNNKNFYFCVLNDSCKKAIFIYYDNDPHYGFADVVQ